jgi:hypothetical protein
MLWLLHLTQRFTGGTSAGVADCSAGCRVWCCMAVLLQPLYKRFLGYEVFGLGFLTSVVSSSGSSMHHRQ